MVFHDEPVTFSFSEQMYLVDGAGNFILDAQGNRIPGTTHRTFRYYELIPPPQYRRATNGQPSVELYVGTEEDLTITNGSTSVEIPILPTPSRTASYVRREDIVHPDYEMVFLRLTDGRHGFAQPEIVNPLAVVSDLQTDREGHLTRRLRALWYKIDPEDRKYPMLFEVEALPYGYSIEVGNIQHYYGTEEDSCSPYYLREEYVIAPSL